MDTPPSGEGAHGRGHSGPHPSLARARTRASAPRSPLAPAFVHVPDGNLLVDLKDCLSPYGHGYNENPPIWDGVSTDSRTYVPLSNGPMTSLDPTCTLRMEVETLHGALTEDSLVDEILATLQDLRHYSLATVATSVVTGSPHHHHPCEPNGVSTKNTDARMRTTT